MPPSSSLKHFQIICNVADLNFPVPPPPPKKKKKKEKKHRHNESLNLFQKSSHVREKLSTNIHSDSTIILFLSVLMVFHTTVWLTVVTILVAEAEEKTKQLVKKHHKEGCQDMY